MLTIFLLSLCLVSEHPEGTVIFFQDGFMAKSIEKWTKSNLTHVAIILKNDGKTWVYESAKGGVQRKAIEEYEEEIKKRLSKKEKLSIEYVRPNPPFTEEELIKMKKYASSQLGRPYMVRGYLKNTEVKGIHCSQYVGNIIGASDRIESWNFKESPGSLYEKLTAN